MKYRLFVSLFILIVANGWLVRAEETTIPIAEGPVATALVQEPESSGEVSKSEILAELKRIRQQLERLEKAIEHSPQAK